MVRARETLVILSAASGSEGSRCWSLARYGECTMMATFIIDESAHNYCIHFFIGLYSRLVPFCVSTRTLRGDIATRFS